MTASPTGPGACLDLAHRPDEWVGIDDMVESAKVNGNRHGRAAAWCAGVGAAYEAPSSSRNQ